MKKSILIGLLVMSHWMTGCGDDFTKAFDGLDFSLLNGMYSQSSTQDAPENYTKWSINNEKMQQKLCSQDGIAELTFELMPDEIQPNFDVWLGKSNEREYEIRVIGDYKVNYPKLKLKAEFLADDLRKKFPDLKNLNLQLLLIRIKYFFLKEGQENLIYKSAQLAGEDDQLFVVIEADQAGRYGWMIDIEEEVDRDFVDDDEEEENKDKVNEKFSELKNSSSATEPFYVTVNHSEQSLGSATDTSFSPTQAAHATVPASDDRLNVNLTEAVRTNATMRVGATLSSEEVATNLEKILDQKEKEVASTSVYDGHDSERSLTGDEFTTFSSKEYVQQQTKEKTKKKKLWRR